MAKRDHRSSGRASHGATEEAPEVLGRFVRWILYGTIFMVPVLVLPNILANPFNSPKTALIVGSACVLAGIWLVRLLAGRSVMIIRSRDTLTVLGLFAVLGLASLLYTSNLYYTRHAVGLGLACIVLIVMMASYKPDPRLVLWLVAGSGVMVSVEAWLEYFGVFILYPWATPGMMVISTIGNSNYLGVYLMFPLMALTGLFLVQKGRLSKAICTIGFFLCLGALVFARSRASWIGFTVGFLAFWAIYWKIWLKTSKNWRIWLLLVILGVFATICLANWGPQRLRGDLSLSRLTDSETIRTRALKYWRASWWITMQNPIIGSGPYSFRNGIFEAQAKIGQSDPSFFEGYREPKPESSHNEWLEIWNDGGLVLVILFICLLRLTWLHFADTIRNEVLHKEIKLISLVCFCSLITVFVASFFFFSFRINASLFMSAMMIGLIESINSKSNCLLSQITINDPPMPFAIGTIAILVLVACFWGKGITPVLAEYHEMKHYQAVASGQFNDAERHILKAIDYNPHFTPMLLTASRFFTGVRGDRITADEYLTRAIYDFNGDLTAYALWYLKGIFLAGSGDLQGAKRALQRSLWYNPNQPEPKERLKEILKLTDPK